MTMGSCVENEGDTHVIETRKVGTFQHTIQVGSWFICNDDGGLFDRHGQWPHAVVRLS